MHIISDPSCCSQRHPIAHHNAGQNVYFPLIFPFLDLKTSKIWGGRALRGSISLGS